MVYFEMSEDESHKNIDELPLVEKEGDAAVKEFETMKAFMDQRIGSIFCYLFPISLLSCLNYLFVGSIYLITPLIFGPKESGSLIAIMGFSQMCAHPFIGIFLTTNTSSEWTLIIGTLMRVFSLIFMSFYLNWYSWIFFMIINGSSISAFDVGMSTYLSQKISAKLRGRFATISMGALRFGLLLGTLITGFAVTHYGYKISLLIHAFISFISFFIIIFLMTPKGIIQKLPGFDGSLTSLKRSYTDENISFKSRLNPFMWMYGHINRSNNSFNHINSLNKQIPIKKVLNDHWKLLAKIGAYVMAVCWCATTRGLIITYQGQKIGLNEKRLGLVNMYGYIPDTTLFLCAGVVMDKYGRKSTGLPSLILFSAACALVGFAETYIELIGVSLIFGLADGIATGMLYAIGSDIAPLDCQASFLGIYWTITVFPASLTPLITGFLVSYKSVSTAGILSSGVALFGFFWMLFVLKDPKEIGMANELKEIEKLERRASLSLSKKALV